MLGYDVSEWPSIGMLRIVMKWNTGNHVYGLRGCWRWKFYRRDTELSCRKTCVFAESQMILQNGNVRGHNKNNYIYVYHVCYKTLLKLHATPARKDNDISRKPRGIRVGVGPRTHARTHSLTHALTHAREKVLTEAAHVCKAILRWPMHPSRCRCNEANACQSQGWTGTRNAEWLIARLIRINRC